MTADALREEKERYARYREAIKQFERRINIRYPQDENFPCWVAFENEQDGIYVDSVKVGVLNDRIVITYAIVNSTRSRLTEDCVKLTDLDPDGFPDHVVEIYWKNSGESPDNGCLKIITDFDSDSPLGETLFDEYLKPSIVRTSEVCHNNCDVFTVEVELNPRGYSPQQQTTLFKRDFPYKSKPVEVNTTAVDGLLDRLRIEDLQSRLEAFLKTGAQLSERIREVLKETDTEGK